MSDTTEPRTQSASESQRTPLERVLLALEERYERLVFFVIARDGPRTHGEINALPEIKQYNLYSGIWTHFLLRKLSDKSILTQDGTGKYAVAPDWQDVANWIQEPTRMEDSLLGLGEWMSPKGLVVAP